MRNEAIGRWLVPGALLGVAAGVAFALFEMLAAWSVGDGFWMPLRRSLSPGSGVAVTTTATPA